MHETYDKLIALLDANKASYRLIDHLSEGQTDKVSALRGHPVEAAAKCIVLIVKIGRKTSRFVLAVVPGDARVHTARSSRCYPAPHMQGLRQRTSPSASLEA
jgi:Ala-tRNA(Pro) deacylase